MGKVKAEANRKEYAVADTAVNAAAFTATA